MERKKILIAPEPEFDARRPLFDLLATLSPADFVAGPTAALAHYDAAIVWAGDDPPPLAGRSGTATLLVNPSSDHRVSVTAGRVEFGAPPWLETCFRQQVLHERGVREFPPLTPAAGDRIVCSLDGQPYWVCRNDGPTEVSTVALGPPFVTERHTVYQHFNRLTWLRLLPFLHFVKRVTQPFDWTPPPLRACLMFDDPNLHWRSYGYIDFEALARHAEANHYHAAMAMIPADAWYYNDRTAAIFQSRRQQLSLLMHGNNHTHAEFGDTPGGGDFARPLAEALRRIGDFERRSNLQVARIMAPPYGAFWTGAAHAMLRLGYEGVCVSRSSLQHWNDDVMWGASFGHNIAEFVSAGFPVIPRHVLARDQEDTYRLAAFLHQPIVPHGHHQDCADGFGGLARAADVINSLGPVTWSDMTALARSNYQTRRIGDTLVVRMLSRHITLPPLDPGVRELVAVRPWIVDTPAPLRETLVCAEANEIRFAGRTPQTSDPIRLSGLGTVTLHSPPRRAVDPRLVEPPRRAVWPMLRRLLSEARDRAKPLTRRYGSGANR